MASIQKQIKRILSAQITDIQLLENGWFSLALHAPEIAANAKPGQFLQVQTGSGADPLLRRPFSIAGITGNQDVCLLIRVVGRGTELLSNKRLGDSLNIIGPLGCGFPEISGNVWTVAGGTGLAPFLFLAKTKSETQHITPFYGACNATDCRFLELPLYRFLMDQAPPFITTEDGKLGARGLVTDVLENQLRTNPDKPAAIFTCGPLPMMRRVRDLAVLHNVPCHVSLEAFMGCGFGACMGCVVAGIPKPYFHVCEDGPVFASEDIDWDRL